MSLMCPPLLAVAALGCGYIYGDLLIDASFKNLSVLADGLRLVSGRMVLNGTANVGRLAFPLLTSARKIVIDLGRNSVNFNNTGTSSSNSNTNSNNSIEFYFRLLEACDLCWVENALPNSVRSVERKTSALRSSAHCFCSLLARSM